MNCIYCDKPTSDGSDEHEECFQRSAAQAVAGSDACVMCGWERGTNPTSCGECAIEADDSVGVGHDDEWEA